MTTRRQLRYLPVTVAALSLCLALPVAAQSDPRHTDPDNPPPGGSVSALPTAPPTAIVPNSEIEGPLPAAVPAVKAPPTSTPPAASEFPTKPLPDDGSGIKNLANLSASDPKPTALDIGGIPLAQLLNSDNTFSGLGSFKLLLPKYGISTYVHGIAIGYLAAQTSDEPDLLNHDGFGNSSVLGAEFNLFVGAELLNRVYAEMQVFYNSDRNRVDIDYAQLDVRLFQDYLFVRGGRFRVPLGNINGYPDPRFTFKLPTLPLFFFQVVPNEWEELGVEFYGRYSWGEGRALSYAFYVVNGLEQRVAQAGDPISGGAISLMTNNYLDNNDPDKAVGGQIQLEPVAGLSFGISGYEGVYTITGKHRIYIADGHMGLTRGKFTLRGEFAATWQETEADTLLKIGGYVLAGYRVIRYLEPVVMFDGFRLDGSRDLDRLEATVGMNYYPFPQKVPSASVRASYSAILKETGEFDNNRFALQAQVAF